MNRSFLETLTSTKLQLGLIFLTSLYIFTLLYIQYKTPYYPEPIELLPQINEQTKRLASTITVGLHVRKFPDFSFTTQTFVMDAIVWFRFPQATETLDTLEKFTFQDSLPLPTGDLILKSPPIIKLIGSEVLVSYHILVKFKSEQLFQQFPLGGHRLIFTLTNKSATSHELNFITQSNNLTLAEKNHGTWQAQKTFAQSGYIKSVLTSQDPAMAIDYPAVVFAIDFDSIGARDLFSLYFPLFVIFFINLLGLIIDIFNFTGLTIIATTLPLLVLYRLVIQGVSPEITYNSHIDFTFYTLVFLSMLIFFIQAYVCLETQKIKEKEEFVLQKTMLEKLETINHISFFVIPFLLILLMTYAFLR